MLTLRKITVPVGDAAPARRGARYLLAATESPAAFEGGLRVATEPGEGAGGEPEAGATWLGSSAALGALGLERGRGVRPNELALALQGRHAGSAAQVRRPGTVVRVRRGARGKPVRVATRAVASLDLTFSAPKSVSVVWCLAAPELRLEIERAMLTAADAVLAYMTQTRPVAMAGRGRSRKRLYEPARGFAAAAALHVTARQARGESAPAPQLHVHGVLVGVERAGGKLVGIESSAIFKDHGPREGGALGRALLAQLLVRIGLEVQPGTGREGRFFELRGVPAGLIYAMSSRAQEVEREIERVEAAARRPMRPRDRALVALKTRERKPAKLTAEELAHAWRALAEQLGFGPAQVAALRRRRRRSRPLDKLRATVSEAIERRAAAFGAGLSDAAARALAFECAAGRLGPVEAHAALAASAYAEHVDRSLSVRLRAIEERARAAAGGQG